MRNRIQSENLPFAVDPDEESFIKNRGGTQWLKHLIHEKMDEWSTAYSEILPQGYRVDFDDALAMAYLPKVMGSGDPTDSTELESIYYRIVRSPEESCIEYIYYWNFQLLPTHSYDYEPIYVYLTNATVKRVAFDLWHYKARVLANVSGFTIWGLWHSFHSLDNTHSQIERPLRRLDEAVLGKWYGRDSKAKFEIKHKLTDPWLLHDWSTFRDERVLPRAQGLFVMTTSGREVIEDDETLQGAIIKESFKLLVKDINRFYRTGPQVNQIIQSVPAKERTDDARDAIRTSISMTQQEILNQFEKAGYMKIVNGNAIWTSKGETIRTMLSSNLE
jgi:hypothetical protein